MEIPRILFEPLKDTDEVNRASNDTSARVKYLVVLDQDGRHSIGQITYKDDRPIFYPYIVSQGWPGWILDDISQKINELEYYHHSQ